MASTTSNSAGVIAPPKGRGRGRGIAQARPGTQQQIKEKTLKEYLRELQNGSMKATFDFVTRPSPRVQEVLDETATEICSRVLQDVEFVETAAEFLKMLWDANLNDNVSIRKPLLIQIQKIYQGRDKLADSEFQSYATFMCDLFGSLLINGEPLNALIGPIYALLRDLLKKNITPDMQNILTFHMVMSKHGSLLQKQNKVKMAELMDQVRDMALSETTKNKVQLCVLLEVIEAHASDWQLSKEVEDYYCNTLGDLMANM